MIRDKKRLSRLERYAIITAGMRAGKSRMCFWQMFYNIMRPRYSDEEWKDLINLLKEIENEEL